MLKTFLLYSIVGYLFFMAVLWLTLEKMIFFPPPASYQDSDTVIKLTTKNGHVISAFYLPNEKSSFTLLVSHGNATDLGYMLPILQLFHDHGFSVFAYDYSGYGTSEGSPSEKQSYEDLNAAYNYLTNQLHISPNRIIAYGQSLGAALAIDLASRTPIAGLILQSPFLSAIRVKTFIPIFPFDKFDSVKKIKQIDCPTLIIHGTQDFVIPAWHGRKIYQMITVPKFYLWVKGAGHNNVIRIAGNRYWQAIGNFVATLNKPV